MSERPKEQKGISNRTYKRMIESAKIRQAELEKIKAERPPISDPYQLYTKSKKQTNVKEQSER
jgi:lysozyme family protein